MTKKIAVIVRDRQAEALRMAVGLTLGEAEVSVFILDQALKHDDQTVGISLETLNELGIRPVSNRPDDKIGFMSTEDIALALALCDTVLSY
jgi:hypothetical protein